MLVSAIPDTTGGILLPPGVTFMDTHGYTWAAPGGGMVTYFFVGPQASIPGLMRERVGEESTGTYGGQMS